MGKLSDPRARALYDEYCSGPGQGNSDCKPDRYSRKPERDPAEARADCLADPRLQEELAAGNRTAAYNLERCLRGLAASDRAAARARAATMLEWELGDTRLAEVVPALARFADSDELAAHLTAIGLLRPGDGLGESREPPISAAEVLMVAGRVHGFDVETDQYPNEHDGLMAKLTDIAGPPLDEAVFEEDAPPYETYDGTWLVGYRVYSELPPGRREGEAYRLRGYLGGLRYATEAQEMGDWYDVQQVLGMLNAMAIGAGSDLRFVTLPTTGQAAYVLAAPKPAIMAAVAEGLLRVDRADAATIAGKEFEERALQHLSENQ
jgi:hypothetical protein